MSSTDLPPCGLYRTKVAIAGVDAGRLVYFHNHGNPGPGIYLPESWTGNRAQFSQNGFTVPPDFDPATLESLPAEGFYRVTAPFHCCAKKCMRFEPETFVQLGYNGNAQALVFLPELGATTIAIPERGTAVDFAVLENLTLLKVATGDASKQPEITFPRGMSFH